MDRRDFLLAAASAIAVPSIRFTEPKSKWFVVNTWFCDYWPVDDPVTWALENANQPILERARERLVQLSPADGERIIRLVVRRTSLILVEVNGERVVVNYWGQDTRIDSLRPFFTNQGLVRNEIEVVLIERKREISTIRPGDQFIYVESKWEPPTGTVGGWLEWFPELGPIDQLLDLMT